MLKSRKVCKGTTWDPMGRHFCVWWRRRHRKWLVFSCKWSHWCKCTNQAETHQKQYNNQVVITSDSIPCDCRRKEHLWAASTLPVEHALNSNVTESCSASIPLAINYSFCRNYFPASFLLGESGPNALISAKSNAAHVYPGALSSSQALTHGVPQGSVLSPLLFLGYINDLPEAVSQPTIVDIFADDTTLSSRSHYTDTVGLWSRLCQSTLEIEEWSRNNRLSQTLTKQNPFL